jgi:hypothetical protein
MNKHKRMPRINQHYLPLAKGMTGIIGSFGALDETDQYTVHPVRSGATTITLHGVKRLVKIVLRDGAVFATAPGATSLANFAFATRQGKLRPEELFILRAQLASNYSASDDPHPSGFGALELLGGGDED